MEMKLRLTKYRTQVTAQQVVITAPAGNTPAVAHVESTDTGLNAPPTTKAQPVQQGGTTTQGVGGAIASVLAPPSNNGGSQPPQATSGPGSNGGSPAQPEQQGQSTPGVGGAIGNVISPGTTGQPKAQGGSSSGSGGSGSGGSGSAGGGSGGASQAGAQTGGAGAALPPPFVVTLSGIPRTIQPTVIPSGQGSVTAFILGPGTTIIEGGSPVTLAGTTIIQGGSTVMQAGTTISLAAPKPSPTTSGGVGNAVASGIGYTGAVSTGDASHVVGIDVLSSWIFALVAGGFGALAFGL